MRIKLDKPFLLKDALKSIKCKIISSECLTHEVTHVCTDSRICHNGDLFIAIKGMSHDGNAYVDEARARGCICIADNSDHAHFTVDDSTAALLSLAEFYKSRMTGLKACIAVTGSVGKSSTKEFLKKIIGACRNAHANFGNYNNTIGVAHTLLTMRYDCEYLICEIGMNHSGEISKLSKCIHPDIAMITNVGTAHIGNLGSREKIAEAKMEILGGMNNGAVLIPYNENLLKATKNAMTVGYNNEPSLSDFTLCKSGTSSYRFIYPGGEINDLYIAINQEHQMMNISMALAASTLSGLSDEEIKKGVKMINSDDLRQRFIEMAGFTIFDDSYNASLESITADLKYLSKGFVGRPIGAFIGDIAELGDSAENIHTQLGRLAAELHLSSLYLIGNYSEYVARGATESGFDDSRIFINNDLNNPEYSIEQINKNHLSEEIILFKGSHSSQIYKIADAMAKTERNRND